MSSGKTAQRDETFGRPNIVFGVAAMLTVLSVMLGAIGMFERILSSNSHYLVFEKKVSDLFFSSVSEESVSFIRELENVEPADPVLFGIVSSDENPVITCFGVDSADSRLDDVEWVAGLLSEFAADDKRVFLGLRAAEFLGVKLGDEVAIGRATMPVGGNNGYSNRCSFTSCSVT